MSDLNNPPQGDPLDLSATGSVADLINTIESDPPAGDPPSGDPPASDPPTGDPPAGDPGDDDDLDDERVNRYLERKGAVALPAETVASILAGSKPIEPAPAVTEAERLAAEQAIKDEANDLEYLRITDPAAYQRKMSDITIRAVQEHASLVDEMVDEVIKSVPEMREPEEISTVRNKLRSMSLDQLKEARVANRHIGAAQSFAYNKLKNMKEQPKKTTAPAQKANDRPNRTEQKPEPQGTSAAKAGLEASLSRRLRKDVVIKQ